MTREEYKSAYQQGYSDAMRDFKEKPQKSGKWIEIDKDMYACSICSHCISIVPEDNRIEQFKYCSFCGKKMIESEEKINGI